MDKELELRVKEYNKHYKEALEEYNKAKAQITVYENEINSLCEELTSHLGVEVTKENALELYQQKEKEIRQQLEIGENIIKRINNEAEDSVSSNDLNTVQGVVADFKMPSKGEQVESGFQSATVESDEFLSESEFGVDLDSSEVSSEIVEPAQDGFMNKPTTVEKQDMGAFNGFFNTSVDDI